jgi:hypothetical protein
LSRAVVIGETQCSLRHQEWSQVRQRAPERDAHAAVLPRRNQIVLHRQVVRKVGVRPCGVPIERIGIRRERTRKLARPLAEATAR